MNKYHQGTDIRSIIKLQDTNVSSTENILVLVVNNDTEEIVKRLANNTAEGYNTADFTARDDTTIEVRMRRSETQDWALGDYRYQVRLQYSDTDFEDMSRLDSGIALGFTLVDPSDYTSLGATSKFISAIANVPSDDELRTLISAFLQAGSNITLTPVDDTLVISASGGGIGAVESVFGRGGHVVAEIGDYNSDQVTEGSINLYFTDERVAATAAVALNTAKVGITTEQAAAIEANSIKVGITQAQADAIEANSIKVGITQAQADAIVANTAKVGITQTQADAIEANTAKVGITTEQSNAILANTAKVGITTQQANAILANTAKVGITTQQANAIEANTAKVSYPSAARVATDYESNANTNKFTDAERDKLSALESSKFLGEFVTLTALQTAHPLPSVGSYAFVDAGPGSNVQKYIWDSSDNQYVLQQGDSTAETPASIKTKYESNANTNAYTDAERDKVGYISVTQPVDLDQIESDTLTNNAKTGITQAQADAIEANTAKVGITPEQAQAITNNTAKVGITAQQAADIETNNAKIGITQSQADAIISNTAKRTYPEADETKVGHLVVTAQTDLDQIRTDVAANNAKVGITTTQATNINNSIDDASISGSTLTLNRVSDTNPITLTLPSGGTTTIPPFMRAIWLAGGDPRSARYSSPAADLRLALNTASNTITPPTVGTLPTDVSITTEGYVRDERDISNKVISLEWSDDNIDFSQVNATTTFQVNTTGSVLTFFYLGQDVAARDGLGGNAPYRTNPRVSEGIVIGVWGGSRTGTAGNYTASGATLWVVDEANKRYLRPDGDWQAAFVELYNNAQGIALNDSYRYERPNEFQAIVVKNRLIIRLNGNTIVDTFFNDDLALNMDGAYFGIGLSHVATGGSIELQNISIEDATADDLTGASGETITSVTQLSDVSSAGSGQIITDDERTKLNGIATDATANSPDATLLNRANHTGTQAASTISDFDAEVSNNADVVANTAKRSYPVVDENKLSNIADNATANSTDSELRDRSTHTGTQTLSTISDAGSIASRNFWQGTQTEYDGLGTYDSNTIYFINE